MLRTRYLAIRWSLVLSNFPFALLYSFPCFVFRCNTINFNNSHIFCICLFFTVILCNFALVVLRLFEVFQYCFVVPAKVSQLRPMIIVSAITPGVYHEVKDRRTSNYFAAWVPNHLDKRMMLR